MTPKDFNEVVKTFQSLINDLVLSKGVEYSPNTDRLANFKRAALFQHCTPEKALLGMLTKQIVSIYDMVDEIEQTSISSYSSKKWEEKVGDIIVYSILLFALVTEGEICE